MFPCMVSFVKEKKDKYVEWKLLPLEIMHSLWVVMRVLLAIMIDLYYY